MEPYLVALLLLVALIVVVRCWRCHERTPLGELPLTSWVLSVKTITKKCPPSGVKVHFT